MQTAVMAFTFGLGALVASVFTQIIAGRRVARLRRAHKGDIEFWRGIWRVDEANALRRQLSDIENPGKLIIDAEPEPRERVYGA